MLGIFHAYASLYKHQTNVSLLTTEVFYCYDLKQTFQVTVSTQWIYTRAWLKRKLTILIAQALFLPHRLQYSNVSSIL